MSTATRDQYGRATTVTDADGRPTNTTYTPATGAQPTTVLVKDPLTHPTTTNLDALRGLPVKVTDPGGYITSTQYDALGRLTAAWPPGRNPVTQAPNLKYTYTISNTGPSVVNTYALNEDQVHVTYRVTETLYDSLLRSRETQTQTPDGFRTITDTTYNTDGLVSATTDPYFNQAPVSPTFVQAQPGQVDSTTAYLYDGAGRRTDTISYAQAIETWRTRYRYGGGNVTTTIPPAGGTATSTFTDARGRTTDLYQYHAGVSADPVTAPPTDYDHTSYTYTPAGQRAGLTDPAGNTWSWQYNLLGQQTQATDPDAGTTTSSYDNAGQVLTRTDGRGAQTTYRYDNAGRRTARYDTTTTQTLSAANQLAAWTYDTVKTGYPASATSFSGGDTYTTTILSYGLFAKPTAIRTTLTGEDPALIPATGYTTSYGFSLIGTPNNHIDPASGGLPNESITEGLTDFGWPHTLGSSRWTSVSAVGYSHFGQPLQYTLPTTGSNVFLGLTYDPQTRAVTDSQVTGTAGVLDHTTYHYSTAAVSKGAGLLMSTVDNQGGGTIDTQCYDYDYAARLRQAWPGPPPTTAPPPPPRATPAQSAAR